MVLDGVTVADPFSGNTAPAGAMAGVMEMELALLLVQFSVTDDPALMLLEEEESATAGMAGRVV